VQWQQVPREWEHDGRAPLGDRGCWRADVGVAIGAMSSLAVLPEPMSTATGWSRAGISSGMTLNFIVMGLGAFGWGAAGDRFGTRSWS
jgi:hypothetical protein